MKALRSPKSLVCMNTLRHSRAVSTISTIKKALDVTAPATTDPEELFGRYKHVQRDLNKDPKAVHELAADTGKLDRMINLYSKIWYRTAEGRLWMLDALAKLAEKQDQTSFVRILTQLIDYALTDRELALYQKILIYDGSMNNRVLTRSSLRQEVERIQKRPDFWQIMSRLLIEASLLEGKPLLAASIALRLEDTTNRGLVSIVLRAFAYDHPKVGIYHLRAMKELVNTFNPIIIEPTTCISIMRGAIKLPFDYFEVAEECYRLVCQGSPGSMAPLAASQNMIFYYLHRGRPLEAERLWNKLVPHHHALLDNTPPVLARLVLAFSQSGKTANTATRLVNQIPEELYAHEGVTEALLTYCARTKDFDLATKVYSHITVPIRRSLLQYLLKLHIEFDDQEGISKIVSEIKSRGDGLKPEEAGSIVRHMAKQSIDEAYNYARKLPGDTIKNICAIELASESIDQQQFAKVEGFLHKVRNPGFSMRLVMTNLRLKALCREGLLGQAITSYKRAMVDGFVDETSRNTLLDAALRLKKPYPMAEFLASEYARAGLDAASRKKLLYGRRNFRGQQGWKPFTSPDPFASRVT